MEYRTLNLTLISAKGLTKSSFIYGKLNVYAVASINGAVGKVQKFKTTIDKDGESNVTWNFPMQFTVNEAACLKNRVTLVVKIKSAGMFVDTNLGEVRVPVKELLEGVKTEGKAMQIVSYPVRRLRYGARKGSVLNISYRFGEMCSGKANGGSGICCLGGFYVGNTANGGGSGGCGGGGGCGGCVCVGCVCGLLG